MSKLIPLSFDSYEALMRNLTDKEYFSQNLGLERMKRLLSYLGNPEKKFASIHIAGTNGKGSTAAICAAIFGEAEYKTGLYTSPHLVDFCERIRVGDENISQHGVMRWAKIISEAPGFETDPLSFFEWTTAMAFLHFAEEDVKAAVIETGLGGRLDATNVITPKISVITSIAQDHTHHLGASIQEIAFEKAGIIKPGVPVVTGPLPSEAMEVIREMASTRNSPLVSVDGSAISDFEVRLEGRHQRENAAVAVTVMQMFREREGFLISDEDIQSGLEAVSWPGRLETIQQRPWIVLDGAHNMAAIRAVVEYFEERLLGRKLTVLFGVMSDKDVQGMLRELGTIAGRFVFTALPMKRCASPSVLQEMAQPLEKESFVFQDVPTALEFILPDLASSEVLLVTGSLFLVGEARQWFEKHA